MLEATSKDYFVHYIRPSVITFIYLISSLLGALLLDLLEWDYQSTICLVFNVYMDTKFQGL